MANKRFGDTLRDLRNSNGYTQQQAADMLGLRNKSTLGSWEVGKSEPDGYTLLKLCKIYNVTDIYSAFGEDSFTKTAPTKTLELSRDESDLINDYRLSSPEDRAAIQRFAFCAALASSAQQNLKEAEKSEEEIVHDWLEEQFGSQEETREAGQG